LTSAIASPKALPPERRRQIVVTGAAGMVGQNLVPRLLASGHSVKAIDKAQGALRVLGERAPGASLHLADLAEDGIWMDLLAGADVVIDLKAQITSPDRALHERNNAVATSKVLTACERHGTLKLIHMSSSVVISKAKDAYTESKRRGEEAVRASRTPHTILRPPLMFGPGDIKHLGLILRMMKILPVVPLPGDSRFIRQPLFVGDLCAVIEASLDRPATGEIFNIIGHERIMFVDLLKEIRRITAARCLLLPLPIALFRAALHVQLLLLSKAIFTIEQLDALTAGDDFKVDGWTDVFGVPFTSFRAAAPRVYTTDDDLRVRLLAAQK
jgi:nucleoside-diphosphate-sugar epimerase